MRQPREWTWAKIKRLRTALRLTQPEFAERLGVARNTVTRWERGVSTPSLPMQRKLSELVK